MLGDNDDNTFSTSFGIGSEYFSYTASASSSRSKTALTCIKACIAEIVVDVSGNMTWSVNSNVISFTNNKYLYSFSAGDKINVSKPTSNTKWLTSVFCKVVF